MAKFISEIIYEKRVKAKLSQAELAHEADISQAIVEYLEKGKYEKLPAKIYVKNILTRIALIIKIDANKLYRQYLGEVKKYKPTQEQEKYFKTSFFKKRSLGHAFYITPQLIIGIFLGLVLTAIVTYLFFQASSLYKAPKLRVEQPVDNLKTKKQVIDVRGQTNANAKVSVNGEQIDVDADGYFQKQISLSEGLNVISVKAENRLEKSTSISRKIIYESQEIENFSSKENEKEKINTLGNENNLRLKVKALSSIASFKIKLDEQQDYTNQVLILDSSMNYFADQSIEIKVDKGSLLELEYNNENLGQFPEDKNSESTKVFEIIPKESEDLQQEKEEEQEL